jgi:hypothetical protein
MNTDQVQQDLQLLLDALRPSLNGRGHVAFYTDAARRLSVIVGKKPAWGWRYIQGVEKGTIEPGRKLTRAVAALAASMDGVPAFVADTEPVQVYARPGAVRPGSVILGESRTCANPGCTISFVPNVPWRRYCPNCGGRKKR